MSAVLFCENILLFAEMFFHFYLRVYFKIISYVCVGSGVKNLFVENFKFFRSDIFNIIFKCVKSPFKYNNCKATVNIVYNTKKQSKSLKH